MSVRRRQHRLDDGTKVWRWIVDVDFTHPDGTQERINIDLKRIRRGKSPDVALQKNDTVVVGEWFF